MAWGLVIGWLICPPNNYGEQIWSANVRRLVAACVDLGTFAQLGVEGGHEARKDAPKARGRSRSHDLRVSERWSLR
eukprot:6498280-Prymnesium_polylepis.1